MKALNEFTLPSAKGDPMSAHLTREELSRVLRAELPEPRSWEWLVVLAGVVMMFAFGFAMGMAA